MKNKMRVRHKLAYSFYNFSAYKDFLVQGLGKGILYLFLVTIVFSTLGTITTVSIFSGNISRLELKLMKRLPDFEYKDGKLTIDHDVAIHYTYKNDSIKKETLENDLFNHNLIIDAEGNSLLLDMFINDLLINHNFIIDTSDQTDISILDQYENGTYINSDSINIKANNGPISTLMLKDYIDTDLSADQSLIINKDTIKDCFSIFNALLGLYIFLATPIFLFLRNIITAFIIISPLTVIISKNLDMKLSFKHSCIISIYAMTTSLLLESLLTASGLTLPNYGVLFYGITLINCSLALKYIKKSGKKNDTKINALL